MLINKRLIGSVSESKPYIAKNIALQWCALAANIVMIGSICRLLERLYTGCAGGGDLLLTAALTLLAVAVRFVCHAGAARMGYLSSKAVKKTLTIPSWLNDMAERNGVNFSGVLQDALKARLNIG